MKPQNESMERYWNNVINAWEDTSYQQGGKAPWLERLAGKFRAHIVERHHTCVRNVRNTVTGKNIVEIGCASGALCFELLENRPQKYVGLDIAEQAVANAKAQAAKRNIVSGVDFFRYTIGEEIPFS